MSSFVNKGSAPKPKGAGRRRVPAAAPSSAKQSTPRLNLEPAPGPLNSEYQGESVITETIEKDGSLNIIAAADPGIAQTVIEPLERATKRRKTGSASSRTTAGAERQPSTGPRTSPASRAQEVVPLPPGVETVRTDIQEQTPGPPKVVATSFLPRQGRQTRSSVAQPSTAASDQQKSRTEKLADAVEAPEIVQYEVPRDAQWIESQSARATTVDGDISPALRTRRKPPSKAKAGTASASSLPAIGILTPEIMAGGRTRKVRKDKGIKRKRKDTIDVDAEEAEEHVQAELNGASRPPPAIADTSDGQQGSRVSKRVSNVRKRKQRAATKATAAAAIALGKGTTSEAVVQAVEEDRDIHPRKKARKPRRSHGEEKLAIGESILMDPNTITMHSISRRNIGTAEKSEREKAMEQIDWNAVKIRRREEMKRYALTRGKIVNEDEDEENLSQDENDEEGEEDLDAQLARAMRRGPKKKTKVIALRDGMQVFDEETDRVNRDELADEDAVIDEFVEDDLTHRFNSHTYQSIRRRDPAERVRNYDRWTEDATDRFYDLLSRYGTDFMIISKMFSGRTRREIKAKFVREERSDPARVEDALKQSLEENAGGWDFDHYRLHAGVTDDQQFRTMEEFRIDEAKMIEERSQEIEEAKRVRAEEKKQKALAGVEDSEDEDALADGAEAVRTAEKPKEKSKKKVSKKKAKKVSKRHKVGHTGVEETVEVLEEIND